MKNIFRISFILIILTFSISAIYTNYSMVSAFARQEEPEEHEEEYEHEDEEEDDDDDDRKNTTQQTTSETEEEVVEEIVIIPQKTEIIEVLPDEFIIDTDEDKLVDAIDPNPQIPEWDFFTDDDGDSVPNALDEHPGEDDFKYTYFIDENENGINDSIELF